jgi:hypothetical protein
MDIALGCGLDDRGFECREGLGIFLFTTASRPALGPTQPPIRWVPVALSLGVKWLGREADHSPPSSAEVKNAWNYTSLPQYAFLTWFSVKKAQGQLYLTFTFSLLGSTAQFRPWPPPQSSSVIRLNFLEASQQFSFYRLEFLAPRPTPILEDQASVFISPRGIVAQLYPQAPGTHFSRVLRHAWVTVGLFLFPGHRTGIPLP